MAADILEDLITANVVAGLAILVLIAGRRVLRYAYGARLAYYAWLLVPAAALVVFLPAPPAWLDLFQADKVRAAGGAGIAAAPAFDWPKVLVRAWLAGAVLAVAGVAVVHLRAIARLGLTQPAGGGHLRTAAPVSGPAVIGVIASKIILPADFEQRFSPREQAVILSHEEAHLAAGDVKVNAAIVLFTCLFWFNPLVHIAARLVRVDQELACDEAVMTRFPEARRTYAEALLKTQVASAPLPLGCYWPERSHQALKERLNMLTLKSPGRGRRIAGAALLAVLGLGTSYVAWAAAPQDAKPSPDQIDEKLDTLLPVDQTARIENDGHGNVLLSYPLPAGAKTSGLTNSRQGGSPAPVRTSRAAPDEDWIEVNNLKYRAELPDTADRVEFFTDVTTRIPTPEEGRSTEDRMSVHQRTDLTTGTVLFTVIPQAAPK